MAAERVAPAEFGERLVAVFEGRLGVVGAFDVGAEKAGKEDRAPACAERRLGVAGVPPASSVAVTRRRRASAICEATVRIQMRSYSFASGPERPCSVLVFMDVPAGRIASWASWALRTLPAYVRGPAVRYSSP